MKESEQLDRIVQALGKVPEKSLLLIELANRFSIEGEIDYEALEKVQPEVNRAIAEAKMYGGHTMVAVNALKYMAARKAGEEDVGP